VHLKQSYSRLSLRSVVASRFRDGLAIFYEGPYTRFFQPRLQLFIFLVEEPTHEIRLEVDLEDLRYEGTLGLFLMLLVLRIGGDVAPEHDGVVRTTGGGCCRPGRMSSDPLEPVTYRDR